MRRISIWVLLAFVTFSLGEIPDKNQVKCIDGEDVRQGTCDNKCDIGFILDTSGSIHAAGYLKQKDFVAKVAQHVGISKNGPHYGVVQFGQHSQVEIKFGDHHEYKDFRKAVMKLPQSGSITRIDRGLTKAYNILFGKAGGCRPNADKMLFLLTDGSQSHAHDVIKNTLIADNLRFIGVTLYVVGIGPRINPKELAAIGGGEEHVFWAKDFDELDSEEFIKNLNIVCDHRLVGQRKRYHLRVTFINNSTSTSKITIEQSHHHKRNKSFSIEPMKEQKFESFVVAIDTPNIKIVATHPGISNELKISYDEHESEVVVLIEDGGLQLLPLKRVIFSINNQMEQEIYLKWIVGGKLDDLYVPAKTASHYHVMNVYKKQDPIVFYAEEKDSKKRVKLNEKLTFSLQVDDNKDIYYLYLYTNPEEVSSIKKKYSVLYKIVNIGKKDIMIYQNSFPFKLTPEEFLLREYNVDSLSQPGPIQLFTGSIDNNRRYHLKYILPVIGGKNETIFVGNAFGVAWHFGFTLECHNLISYDVTLKWKLMSHAYNEIVQPGISYHEFHMAFLFYIPSKEVRGVYSKNGQTKVALLNNKPYDFIGTDFRNDMLPIIISEKQARKYHFFGVIKNENENPIKLTWSPTNLKYLLKPIPRNNILIPGNSSKQLRQVFWSIKDLKSVTYTAQGIGDAVMSTINGRFSQVFTLFNSKPPESVPILIKRGLPLFVKLLVNNALDVDVVMKWSFLESKLSFNDKNIISNRELPIVPAGKKLLVTLKFQSEKLLNEDIRKNVISIRFFDTETNDELFMNQESKQYLASLTNNENKNPIEIDISISRYYYYLNIIAQNELKKNNVKLIWKLNQLQPILKTRMESSFDISNGESLPISFKFYSSQKLAASDIQDLLRLTVVDMETNQAFILNGLEALDYHLFQDANDPIVINITHPGSLDPVPALDLVNVTKSSITIRWKRNKFARNYKLRTLNQDNAIQSEMIKTHDGKHEYMYHTFHGLDYNKTYSVFVQPNVPKSKVSFVEAVTNPNLKPSVISLQINNLWNQNIIIQWEASGYSGNKLAVDAGINKTHTIIFPYSKIPNSADFQIIEEETKLLLLFPDKKDSFSITPEYYKQHYIFEIHGADRISIYWPYYLYLKITNLAFNSGTAKIKNVFGEVLAEKFIFPAQSDVEMDTMVLYKDFPLLHYFQILSAEDGMIINGENVISLIPTFRRVPINLYIGQQADSEDMPKTYFMDTTIQNNWKNPVSFIWQEGSKLGSVNLPEYKSKQFVIVSSGDNHPRILSKLVDTTGEQIMKIHGRFQTKSNFTEMLQPVIWNIDAEGNTKILYTYYILLLVTNLHAEDAIIKWEDNIKIVRSGAKDILKVAMVKQQEPLAITFRASTPQDATLFINGRKSLDVLASLQQTVIKINLTAVHDTKVPITIQFINLLESQVFVAWTNLLHMNHYLVDRKSFNNITVFASLGEELEVTGKLLSSGVKTTLNGSSILRIDPLNYRASDVIVFIGATRDELDPSFVPYFFYVTFQNLNPEDIKIKWIENNVKKQLNIKAGSKKEYANIFMLKSAPDSINFRFYGNNDNDQLYVNGKDVMSITPSSNAGKTDVIFDTVSTARLYFLNLVIVNTLLYETKLQANDRSLDFSYSIPPNSYQEKHVQIAVSGQLTPVQLEAITDGKIEFINGVQGGVKVMPARNEQKRYLYIGYEGTPSNVQYLQILHMNMSVTNMRKNPVAMEWKNDKLNGKNIVIPGSTVIYETVLVGQDVTEIISLKFYDESTKKLLLVNGKWDSYFDYKKVNENMFLLHTSVLFNEKQKEALYLSKLSLNVINKEEAIAQLYHKFKNHDANFEVKAFSKKSISFTLPISDKNDQVVFRSVNVHSGSQLLVNKQEELPIPLNERFITAVMIIKNKGQVLGSKFIILNTLKENIEFSWKVNDDTQTVNIGPMERHLFIIYTSSDDDNLNPILLTAKSDKNEESLYLNRKLKYYLDVKDELVESISIMITDTEEEPKNLVVALDFANEEDTTILLHRTVSSENDVTLPSTKVDGGERKRIYVKFPNVAAYLNIQAEQLADKSAVTFDNEHLLKIYADNKYFKDFHMKKFNGLESTYKYQIDIDNMLSNDAVIYWYHGRYFRKRIVPAGDRVILTGKISGYSKPEKIYFSAVNKLDNKVLYLNGQKLFSTLPSLKDRRIFIRLGKEELKSLTYKEYFIVLAVNNNVNEEVSLLWQLYGKGYITNIPVEKKMILQLHVRSSVVPEAVEFRCYISANQNPVVLNSKDFIIMKPTDTKVEVPVYIDKKGSKMKTYYANLHFINQYPFPVNIEWHVNKERRLFSILPNEIALVKDSLRSNEPEVELIPFQAWDVSSKTNVLMNQRKLFKYAPTLDSSVREDVVLSPDESTYIYKAVLDNRNGLDVELSWHFFIKTGGGKRLEEKSLTSVTTIRKGSKGLNMIKQYTKEPDAIVVTAFNTISEKQVYINNQLDVTLNETSKGNDNVLVLGKDVSEQAFYFKMIISNLYGKTIAVTWACNGKESRRLIPPYYFNYVVKSACKGFTPVPVSIKSYVLRNQRKMYTNDMEVLSIVSTTLEKLKFNRVFVSLYRTERTTKLYFKNPTFNEITIRWNTGSFSGEHAIPSQSSRYAVVITTNGGYRHQRVLLKALPDENGDIVVNSGVTFVTRIPYYKVITLGYLQKDIVLNNTLPYDVIIDAPVVDYKATVPANSFIKLHIPGKKLRESGIVFSAMTKREGENVPINGLMKFRVQLDTEETNLQIGAKPAQNYFVRLWISNNHTNAVNLSWSNASQVSFEVPFGFDNEVTFSFDTPNTLIVSATDLETRKPVYLNQRDELMLKPKKSNRYATSIVLNGQIYPYDYFYRLSVKNNARNIVSIQLKKGFETREAIVPPRQSNYSINSPLTDLDHGLKQAMKVYAYDKRTMNPLYINSGEYVLVYPTLNDEDAIDIELDGRELPMSLYYYSILVTVQNDVNVLLKYNLSDGAKITRIPTKAKNFAVTIPIKSFQKPKDVAVFAVDEATNQLLRINKKHESAMISALNKEQYQRFEISLPSFQEASAKVSSVHFKAILNNPNDHSVRLYWQHKTTNGSEVIPKFTYNLKFIFNLTGDTSLSDFIKLYAEADDMNLLMNNKTFVILNPITGFNDVRVLNISTITQTLTFINKAKVTVHLKYDIEGHPHRAIIDKDGGVVRVPVDHNIIFTSMVHDILLNDEAFLQIATKIDKNQTIILSRVKFVVKVIIMNSFDYNVYLNWTIDGKPNKAEIPANTPHHEIILHLHTRDPVLFSAHNKNGNPLLVNNGTAFSVIPTIGVGNTKFSITEPLTQYYYSIEIKNKNKLPITLICLINNKKDRFKMLPDQDEIIMRYKVEAGRLPDDIVCKALQTQTGSPLIINHLSQLEVAASLDPNVITPASVTFISYVAKVHVANALPIQIVLIWHIGNDTVTKNVRERTNGQVFYIHSQTRNDIKVKGTTYQGRPLYLNDVESVSVTPSLDSKRVFYILTKPAPYYNNLNVENLELFDVYVRWTVNGEKHAKLIKGGQSRHIVVLDENVGNHSKPIIFTAVRAWRGKVMFLNNEESFTVPPTLKRNKYVYVLISSRQKNLNALTFINIAVTNLVKNSVYLQWQRENDVDNEEQLIEAGTRRTMLYLPFEFDRNTSALVKFTAVLSESRRNVRINKQTALFLKPKPTNEVTSIIITDKDSENPSYHVHVEVQNHHHSPVLIEYRQAGVKGSHGFPVPERYHKWVNLAFHKPRDYPMSIEFRAYDALHYTILKMNYQISVLFQTKRLQETLTLSIGDAVPQTKSGHRHAPVTSNQNIYFFGIHVINNGRKNVTIYWRENGKRIYLTIPGNSQKEHMSLVRSNNQQPWIPVRGRRGVKINGKAVYFVRASVGKRMSYLYVNGEDKHKFHHQYYYYALKVDNLASLDVDIRWKEGKIDRLLKVDSLKSKTFHNIIKSDSTPDSMILRGFKTGTNETLLLNYKEGVMVQPSKRSIVTYILIEPDDESVRLKTYFFGLDVKNLYIDSVTLSWLEGDTKRFLSVNGYGSQHYDTSLVSSLQPGVIKVSGYTTKTKQKIQIDGKDNVLLSPTRERGRYVLVLGKPVVTSNTFQDYHLTIQLDNKEKIPLLLQWIQVRKQNFSIPARSVVKKHITVNNNSQPAPIEFKVVNMNGEPGTINGQDRFALQPRLNGYFSHVYVSGNGRYKGYDQPGDRLKCREILDIAFLLDSSGTMKGSYPYAQQFIMLLSEHFHLSPNSTHISVITFSETAELDIPLNRHQNHDEFQRDVFSLPFLGFRTRIDLALELANTHLFDSKKGARSDASKLVILLTDGRHTHGNRALRRAYDSSLPLLNKKVKIVAIGLFGTHPTDVSMLSHLTRSDKNVYLVAHSPDLLSKPFLDDITQTYCPI